MSLGPVPGGGPKTPAVAAVRDVVGVSEHDDLTALLRWLGDQATGSRVELVCAHDPSPVRAHRTSSWCASTAVPASCRWLLTWSSLPPGAAVVVRTAQCPQAERTAASVAAANRFLGVWPDAPRLSERTDEQRRHRRARVYDLGRLPLSRRRLLFFAQLDNSWMPEVKLAQRSRVVVAAAVLEPQRLGPERHRRVSVVVCQPGSVGLHGLWRLCPGLSDRRAQPGTGRLRLRALRTRTHGRLPATTAVVAWLCAQRGDGSHRPGRLGAPSRCQLADSRAGAVRRCARCGGSFAETDLAGTARRVRSGWRTPSDPGCLRLRPPESGRLAWALGR